MFTTPFLSVNLEFVISFSMFTTPNLWQSIMKKFIGRQAELEHLDKISQLKKASFIVVKGRRRIGKSRLIKEFGKSFSHFYTFSGLAPDERTTNEHQLDEFSRQISREFGTAPAKYSDWSDAFWAIAAHLKKGKILLLFDEISWMGSKDPTFLSKIKNLWDLNLSNNPNLMFVICGSASSWIDKNILSSTGFVGRISLTLTLKELTLSECSQFWPTNISPYEKLKLLSITGGVPKYLEEVDPKINAEENIRNLCFKNGGFLVDEFERIFPDIFLRNSDFYKKIVSLLVEGALELKEIEKRLGDNYGRISEYLQELESAGFITRDYAWNIKSGFDAPKLSKFRLKDNYLRFYLKYIERNLTKIHRDAYSLKSLTSLPEWHSLMGLQFENLVLNNRPYLHAALGIHPTDIVCENPFFQRKSSTSAGCQIDYMIQTRFNSLYVCEIKFSKDKISSSVIEEVQQKIDALKRPKGYSCRPVLIHVNGVTDQLIEEDYFSSIIDVSAFLATSGKGDGSPFTRLI